LPIAIVYLLGLQYVKQKGKPVWSEPDRRGKTRSTFAHY